MFAYCGNNPIPREDVTGAGWYVLIAAAASGTIALITSIVSETIDSETEDGDRGLKGYELLNVFISTTCASADGALSALRPNWSPLISGGFAALESLLSSVVDNNMGDPKPKTSAPAMVAYAINAGGMSALTATIGMDDIRRGTNLTDELIESSGKASNIAGMHPKIKQPIVKAARKAKRKFKDFCIENSIDGQFTSFVLEVIDELIKLQ